MINLVENGAPYMYDYRNAVISSVEPSTVHARDTVITWYWRRWLLQKAMSLFTWMSGSGDTKMGEVLCGNLLYRER